MIVRKAVWSMVGMMREDELRCCEIQMLEVLVNLITAGLSLKKLEGILGLGEWT